MAGPSPQLCVYTCLIGDYEDLNEQPVAAASTMPFICLTDNPRLVSRTWKIVPVQALYPSDPIRSQRHLKALPYLHLPEFGQSLYIDNAVQLLKTPEEILTGWAAEGDFALPHHFFRPTVLDEFLEVEKYGLDEPARVFEQLHHYMRDGLEVLDERPFWTGMLLRSHGSAAVRRLMETWNAHIMRYSRRDQLSLNMAMRLTGFIPHVIPLDNYESEYHRWPLTPGRDRQRGMRDPHASHMPLVGRVRELETALQTRSDSLHGLHMQLAAMANQHEGAMAQQEQFIARLRDRLARSQSQRDADKTKIARLKSRLQQKDEEHKALTSSLAWKITGPWRKVLRWLKSRPATPDPEQPLVMAELANAKESPARYALTAQGRKIYVLPEDLRGESLIQAHGNLNPVTLQAWKLLAARGNWTHVIDIGANYGEMLALLNLPGHPEVIAVEPSPQVAACLKHTLAEAGLHVTVIEQAIAQEAGTSTLVVDRTYSGISGLSGVSRKTEGHQLETLQVTAITLGDLIRHAGARPDSRLLIKIDVEGHEVSILKGGLASLYAQEDFAVLIEILHLSDDDMGWLLAHFTVQVYDMGLGRLAEVAAGSSEDLKAKLEGGSLYRQDVVLVRRATDGSARTAPSHTSTSSAVAV